jgi:transcriptional regulator with XRE-family HTH domain
MGHDRIDEDQDVREEVHGRGGTGTVLVRTQLLRGEDAKGMTFGERLRDARTKAGLSQAEMTRRCGVPKTMLSRYENDHILPSIATLEKLADALRISSSSLLEGKGAITQAFTDGLLARGIEMHDQQEAARLAEFVADLVDADDSSVRFLQHDDRRLG